MKKILICFSILFLTNILTAQTFIATSNHPDATANHNQRKIVRDASDNIYIVYQDIVDEDTVIKGVYLNRETEEWSEPFVICVGKNPTLAISEDCKYFLIYESSELISSISLRSSTDFINWSEEIVLSDTGLDSKLPVADVDYSGSLNIFWIEGSGANTSVKYLRYEDNTIQQNQTVLTQTGINDIAIANHLRYINQTILWAVSFDADSLYFMKTHDYFNNNEIIYKTIGTYPCVTYNYITTLNYDETSDYRFIFIGEDQMIYEVWGIGPTIRPDDIYINCIEELTAEYLCVDDVLLPLGYSFLFLNNEGLFHAFRVDQGLTFFMDNIQNGLAYNPSIAYKQYRFEVVDFIWTEKEGEIYNIYYTRDDKYIDIYDDVNEYSNSKLKITASPNPFSDKVLIDLTGIITEEKTRIRIYTIKGELILDEIAEGRYFTWSVKDSNTNIKSGQYVILVENGGIRVAGKLIKQ